MSHDNWSPFWRGAWLGWTGPIHMLSLRRYRKGERYSIEGPLGGLPIEIRHDWSRWNGIRWRWNLWLNHQWMRRLP